MDFVSRWKLACELQPWSKSSFLSSFGFILVFPVVFHFWLINNCGLAKIIWDYKLKDGSCLGLKCHFDRTFQNRIRLFKRNFQELLHLTFYIPSGHFSWIRSCVFKLIFFFFGPQIWVYLTFDDWLRILSVYENSWLLIIWGQNWELCILLALFLLLACVETCGPFSRDAKVGDVIYTRHWDEGLKGARGAGKMFRFLTTMRLLDSI